MSDLSVGVNVNNKLCILKWAGKNKDFKLYLIHMKDQVEIHIETVLRR